MKDMLGRWSRTGEFRDVPQDEFLEVMLAAQKDRSTSDAALFLCWLRYKNNPPPADLIKVLLDAPTDGWLGHLPHWYLVTRLYLDNHKISVEQGSVLLLKAARAICLPDVFDRLRDNLSQDVWKAMVLAIQDAKGGDLLVMGLELRKCKKHFDAESVKYVHGLVKTRNPKKLAPLIAAVLPDDLSVVTQWMSLCEAQKTDVAVRLLWNMMFVEGSQPFDIDYWQSRLNEACEARREATDLAKAWLDLYQDSLHGKIGEIFWQRGNETFKIGFVETAAEKEEFDNLEAWLEDPDNGVIGKDKLLHKIRNDKDGARRKSGHVWHAKLTKDLYESRKFKSMEVEHEISGSGGAVDILLEDEHGRDIHIEAWDGTTELSHSLIRMLQTGKRFNINKIGQHGIEDAVFGWKHANRWLNNKVKQLPPTGRNFVLARYPPDEFPWQSMEGVDLKDNVCAIQVVPPRVHVWCRDWKCMGETARLVSESLGLEYYPIDGGW